MMPLTNTKRDILNAAAQHPELIACPPRRQPTGARQSVAKALLRHGLVNATESPASDAATVWTLDGASAVLVISQQGFDAVGTGPAEMPTAETTACFALAADGPGGLGCGNTVGDAPGPRLGLRSAATALLAAWDDCPAQDTTDNPISCAMNDLRTALQGRQPRNSRPTGAPCQGTKQEAVLALLRRPEGATIAQVMEATGWQQHTVRGFFAGLKKRQGISVTVLERVRQVGPGAHGSRGSHSIYAVVA